jgi:hypothetical protein
MTNLDRLFSVVDGDDPAVRRRRLRSFEVIFALVVGAEYWLRAVPKWGLLAAHYYALLPVAGGGCGPPIPSWWRRPAFAALAASHAVLVSTEFPSTGNHAYLELVVCLLAAFLTLDDEVEQRLYLRALRWIAVVVLFYSGIQKLAQGYYLHGEYLAFSLGSSAFRPVAGLLLSPDELARLAALAGEVGDGPYRVASTAFLLVSNATWIAEIGLAAALCWRRTRGVAVAAALLLLLAIESAARELFFGLVFADAILLFTWGDRHSRVVPAVVALLAALSLARLGVLPDMTFY